jgi:hypothetical protein
VYGVGLGRTAVTLGNTVRKNDKGEGYYHLQPSSVAGQSCTFVTPRGHHSFGGCVPAIVPAQGSLPQPTPWLFLTLMPGDSLTTGSRVPQT